MRCIYQELFDYKENSKQKPRIWFWTHIAKNFWVYKCIQSKEGGWNGNHTKEHLSSRRNRDLRIISYNSNAINYASWFIEFIYIYPCWSYHFEWFISIRNMIFIIDKCVTYTVQNMFSVVSFTYSQHFHVTVIYWSYLIRVLLQSSHGFVNLSFLNFKISICSTFGDPNSSMLWRVISGTSSKQLW